MAIIPNKRLFGYRECEDLGDLERLKLVMEILPDEKLMRHLERKRKHGRNDNPIRGMWNSILAGIVFEHESIESLRRELQRNGQLRYLCGLPNGTPSASAYSRFLDKLMGEEHFEYIEEMFEELVEELKELIDDFGEVMAVDGKAVESFANPHDYDKEELKKRKDDRRSDLDANWGVKKYECEDEDGNTYEKLKSWFGYKIHLLIDAEYELPINFTVTKASAGEAPQAHKLVEDTADKHPELMENCRHLLGDRGYDDGKLSKKLYNKHEIKPIIDIRNMWEGESTKVLSGWDNIVYDYKASVYCYDPATGVRREMAYGGFEKKRETLKYRCPARHYGCDCKGKKECSVSSSIRIPLSEDKRRFTPVARSSYKWERIYNKRSAVERVNSRLEGPLGFSEHTVRGLKKMKLKTGLSLLIMLAMAVGRIKEGQKDKIRSLVQAA